MTRGKCFFIISIILFILVYGYMIEEHFYKHYWNPLIESTPVEVQPKPVPKKILQYAHNHDPTGKPPGVVVFLFPKSCKSG
jgi:hypothetical protein